MIILLSLLSGFAAVIFVIGTFIAYGDGGDGANYYGYENGYWIVWAWAYDLGYDRKMYLIDNPKVTAKEKNKARREARLAARERANVVEDAPVDEPRLRRFFK